MLLAYGEEDNLEIVLPLIHEIMQRENIEYDITVIDANPSVDDSKAVCMRHETNYVNQKEPYFGGAFKTAIDCASRRLFLILDADCSCNPKDIATLIARKQATDCDLVIGSRYVEGGRSEGSATSLLMSKLLNRMFRMALDVDAKDLSIDYRVYNTADLKKLDLQCDNYDILEEVILKSKIQKEVGEQRGAFAIEEVPIAFEKRQNGSSKRKLVKFIMNYLKTLIRLWAMRLFAEKERKNWDVIESKAELASNIGLYVIIGSLGAIVDYCVFALVLLAADWPAPDTIFQFAGIAEVANIAGALAGSLVCFWLNSFYNFMTYDHLFRRYALYVLAILLGTCLSTGLMLLLRSSMDIMFVKLICVCIAAVLQFLLNKNLAFATTTANKKSQTA